MRHSTSTPRTKESRKSMPLIGLISASASKAGAIVAVGWMTVAVRVVKIADIGADRVEKRCAQSVDAFCSADDRGLRGDGKFQQRAECDLEWPVLAARDRRGEEVDQRSLGFMDHGRRDLVESRPGHELRDAHARIADFSHWRFRSSGTVNRPLRFAAALPVRAFRISPRRPSNARTAL